MKCFLFALKKCHRFNDFFSVPQELVDLVSSAFWLGRLASSNSYFIPESINLLDIYYDLLDMALPITTPLPTQDN
jgi:hypothetical protein